MPALLQSSWTTSRSDKEYRYTLEVRLYPTILLYGERHRQSEVSLRWKGFYMKSGAHQRDVDACRLAYVGLLIKNFALTLSL